MRLEATLTGPNRATLWSGKYDGVLEDSFDWQDATGEQVAAEVMGMILDVEIARLEAVPEGVLNAAQVLLLARMKFRNTREETFLETLGLMGQAIDMQPGFPEALGEAIMLTLAASTVGYASIRPFLARVPSWVEAGRALNEQTPSLELSIALYDYMQNRDAPTAREIIGRTVRRAPSDVRLLAHAGWCYNWMGAPDLALDCFERFRRLGRFDPNLAAVEGGSALAHFLVGNDAAAIRAAERGLQITRGYPSLFATLAAANVRQGNLEKARDYAAQYMTLLPDSTIDKRRRVTTYGGGEAEEACLEALEKAGIPND